MKGWRIVRTGAGALARFKLRTAFMTMGTFIGVATLTIVLSVGAAARDKLLTTVRQLFGASSVVITSGGGFFMGGPRDATRLTIDDVRSVATDVPGIALWDPMQIAPDTPVRWGDRNTTVRLMALSERGEQAWGRTAVRGRYLDAADVAASSRVALVGQTVVRDLFTSNDPVGEEIRVGGVPFRVIGVLESFGTDVHGMDRDNEIVVPITTAMRRVMNVDSLRAAKLVVDDPQQVERVTREVTRALRERHGLTEGQPDDFTVVTSTAVRQMVGRIERVLFVYLPLVTAVSLLVAMGVAASLMLASVGERTAEIGLRRAVGATQRDIRLQFLVETAATAVTGGAAGVVAGGIISSSVAQRFALDGGISWIAVVVGLFVSVVTGLLAGVAPAQRAARLLPADSLR